MPLLLLFGEAAAPPIVGPRSRLGLNAVPRHEGAGFPSRAPQVVLGLDPAVLTWQGQAPNLPTRLTLDPADLRWIGRTLPGHQFTSLGLAAVSGGVRGPFPPRQPKVVLLLDPATLAWTGQTVTLPADAVAPADLTWIGQEVVVRVRGALRPFTRLGLAAVSIRRGPGFTTRDALTAGPAALTWQGQEVVVRIVLAVACEPADLTWQGQNVPDPRVIGGFDRELQPLTGVR